MRRKWGAAGLSLLLFLVPYPSASREQPAVSGDGMELVASVPYVDGTHLALATIKGRDYAFAATAVRSGSTGPAELRVIDVTWPERPRVVATMSCGFYQGHLQISHDKKTLIVGIDIAGVAGDCFPTGQMGFATIDISDPTHPKPAGYALVERGSHSTAAHPTKPFVYNGDGFPEAPGEMQIWSIKNPAKPKLVNTFDSGAHSPHDLSFNADGSMAATANIVNFQLLDTSDPVNPKLVSAGQCPGCQHTHEARFTPDGAHLVVNDEALAGPYPCPGGALYFYDLTSTPAGVGAVLTGAYTIGDRATNSAGEPGFCTPHSFGISADGTKVAASWHSAGTRYLDISERSGLAVGSEVVPPGAVRELGWATRAGGDAFSAKFHRGPYLYSVDSTTGLDIFRIE